MGKPLLKISLRAERGRAEGQEEAIGCQRKSSISCCVGARDGFSLFEFKIPSASEGSLNICPLTAG